VSEWGVGRERVLTAINPILSLSNKILERGVDSVGRLHTAILKDSYYIKSFGMEPVFGLCNGSDAMK